ncbi:UNVERIFIED_CONTAM: hypothetical protein Scaly_2793600 [Sesamum calycinum]|uniref:Reverse transcriptase RNase H-like domain-containing protein n=1 Tax=Sesamum calycinum TaxID=2727403 RepID=A0AAW2IYA9_9LAMI
MFGQRGGAIKEEVDKMLQAGYIRPVQYPEWRNPYLYLAVSENAVSSVLVRQENREHLPVYYVSKVLQGAEPRYSQIEKLALSLVIAARKLRPYFQSHQVTVLTNHPLKQLLASPKLSGRMVKWAVELSEYGIEFHPRPAIKAQVLADFVVELAYDEASISTPTWSVYVDGSSTSTGSGAGVALESPQGDKFEYAIKLDFPSSNNEAEYEAFFGWLDHQIPHKGGPTREQKRCEGPEKESLPFRHDRRRLYKRGFSQPFLKCLTPEEGNYVLEKYMKGFAEIIWRKGLGREEFEARILLAHNARGRA